MLKFLSAALVVIVMSTATATAANADAVFIGYDDEQAVSLYRGAGYIDRTPELFATDALGVHHFLLGISQKLEDPGGGCDLNLQEFVDLGNGPHFFLIEDPSTESLGAVGGYYCLTDAAAIEVSVTLLVFLAFANANQLGISIPDLVAPTSARATGFANPFRHVFFQPGGAIAERPIFINSMAEDADEQMLFFRAVDPSAACAFGRIEHGGGTTDVRVELIPNGCANSAALPDAANQVSLSDGQMLRVQDIGAFAGLRLTNTDTVQWNVDDAAGGFFGNTAPAFFEPFDVEGVDRIVPAAGEVYGVPAKLSDMVGVPRVDTAAGTCVPDGLEVCSANERFKVVLDIDYPMDATPRFLDGPDDGLFYFFTPTGQEHLVRVLNGCNINGHYWVFAGGLTNIDYELTVTDTVSGSTQMFANTPGNAFDPIVDTQAFATCP